MTEPIFKVGDIIFNKMLGTRTVIAVVKVPQTIKGRWKSGSEYHKANNCYVLENITGYLSWIEFRNAHEMYSREEASASAVNKNYPHTCRLCKAPAYINFFEEILCSNPNCKFKEEK